MKEVPVGKKAIFIPELRTPLTLKFLGAYRCQCDASRNKSANSDGYNFTYSCLSISGQCYSDSRIYYIYMMRLNENILSSCSWKLCICAHHSVDINWVCYVTLWLHMPADRR